MSLIKWEPMNDLETMMDRVLSWPGMRLGSAMALRDWGPSVDIVESDGCYLFKVDAPGIKREDLQVSLAGGLLTIQGERRIESEQKKSRFHRIERSYGRFSRSFSLPEDADPGSIKAHVEDGELTVSLARKADSPARQVTSVPVT